MQIYKTKLEDCYILRSKQFHDFRGYFSPYYVESEFLENKLDFNGVKQCSRALSQKGVLRGLHFQIAPHAQSKIVEVVNGSIIDVVVDLREESKTYLQHLAVLLTADDNKSLLIPKGFAQGYLALENNTLVEYLADNEFAPDYERGLLYSDETINIAWNSICKKYDIDNLIVSPKDQKQKSLIRKYRF